MNRSVLITALAVCLALVSSSRVATADHPIDVVDMGFSEYKGNLTVSMSIVDLFDAKAFEQLSSGVASLIVVRFYVHRKGQQTPAAFALAKIRVVYDHWDEKYLVRVEGPLGSWKSSYKLRSQAFSAVTVFDKFPISPLSRIPIGPKFILSMVVELNPLSPELLAEVRRWLTKPAGQARLDSGSAFFGSFVSVFVNPKLAEADRIVKYRSQQFYRVKSATAPP